MSQINGNKVCLECRLAKPPTNFSRNKNNKDALSLYCRGCESDRHRAWRSDNPEKSKASKKAYYEDNKAYVQEYCRTWREANSANVKGLNLKKYWPNIPWQERLIKYDALHSDQHGVCKVCQLPETSTRRGRLMDLAVDHCHTTGEVRGLLCNRCNRAAGLCSDNPDILTKLATYLTKSTPNRD